MVEVAMGRVGGKRRHPTEDGVVGALPFGFWVGMLANEDRWIASLSRAFPHGNGLRKQVAGPLNRVSHLRNRAAHHEAILHLPINDRLDDLLLMAGAIDPRAQAWIRGVSRVHQVLADRPSAGVLRLRASSAMRARRLLG